MSPCCTSHKGDPSVRDCKSLMWSTVGFPSRIALSASLNNLFLFFSFSVIFGLFSSTLTLFCSVKTTTFDTIAHKFHPSMRIIDECDL
jgi:hypothetical protein